MVESLTDILLVENNPYDVELTIFALDTRNLGNRVKVLSDGEEALDYIFRTGKYKEDGDVPKNPVLILLELKLPKIAGDEVLCRIRSDERTKRIPVIVLTASREETERLKCYDLGVNSYIEKPVEKDNFITAVGEVGYYWAVLNKAP
jgi:CheY-like chemotaxis protein